VTAYGVLGGADFGGGIWDLFAAGPRRDEQRRAIARAMGPVWEGQSCMADLRDRPAFHSLPARLCSSKHRLVRTLSLRPRGHHAARAAFVFREPAAVGSGSKPLG